jgi:hypothetical protein
MCVSLLMDGLYASNIFIYNIVQDDSTYYADAETNQNPLSSVNIVLRSPIGQTVFFNISPESDTYSSPQLNFHHDSFYTTNIGAK